MFLPAKVSGLISICWLTFILIVFSNAVPDLVIALCTCLVLLIWGASLVLRGILILLSNWRQRDPIQRHQSWAWTIEPFVLLLSIILPIWQVPLMLRLKLSETALIDYIQVERKVRHPQQLSVHPRRWVGLFEVRETEILDGGVVRMITGGAFLDGAGVVYSPDRQPPTKGEHNYRHLYGNWWSWQRSW